MQDRSIFSPLRGSTRALLLLSMAMGLASLGCPVKPEKKMPKVGGPEFEGSPGPGEGGEFQGGPGGPGAGGPDGAGGPGGPGGGGPGGGGPDGGSPGGMGGGMEPPGPTLDELKPQMNQTEIAAAEHVSLAGKVEGECTGRLRLDVIEAGTFMSRGNAARPPGPLTVIELSGPGAFSGLAPKGHTIIVSALCDQDRDGQMGAGDLVSFGEILGATDKDYTQIDMILKPFPKGGGASGQRGKGGGPRGPGGAGGAPPGEGAPPQGEGPGGKKDARE